MLPSYLNNIFLLPFSIVYKYFSKKKRKKLSDIIIRIRLIIFLLYIENNAHICVHSACEAAAHANNPVGVLRNW